MADRPVLIVRTQTPIISRRGLMDAARQLAHGSLGFVQQALLDAQGLAAQAVGTGVSALERLREDVVRLAHEADPKPSPQPAPAAPSKPPPNATGAGGAN